VAQVVQAQRGPQGRVLKRVFVQVVRELANRLAELAGDPGDRSIRQKAADGALEVARRIAAGPMPSDAEAVAAIVALGTVASDLMVFAGVDAAQADAAVREGTGEFRVPSPTSSP
jgi:hypothetical protein